MSDIVDKLLDACVGTPAKIEWPHRLLHDAVAEIRKLRADLVPPPCPEGWVMVPAEPTIEMLIALEKEPNTVKLWAYGSTHAKYKAMLTAAPKPPAGGDV